MPSEVILPRVDMDMTTGKIAKWFVEPGATVTKGQPLFEIETDKAAMEIEAPDSGTIRDLAAASGADIPVGSVVAWIDRAGEAAAPLAQSSNSGVASRPADAGRVAVEDAVFDSALPPPMRAPVAEAPSAVGVAADRPRATPMARRLARDRGLDLAALQGSGPRGRVQADDVMAAAAPTAALLEPVTPSAPHVALVPAGTVRAADPGPLNIVQLREGSGRPTLLIHGFGADANTWRPFLAGRPTARPVLALDLPGHGSSALGTVTSFATLVDAVEAALSAAGLDAIDLVGHSLGAAVAAAVVARGALDIRSLLLLSPAGLGPEVNGAFVRGFLGATSEASLTPWMHELASDPAIITPAFIRSTLKAREGSGLVAAQRRVADAVFPDGTQAFSIRADLARLTVPTRVVFGTADKIIPAKQATGLPGLVALHLLPNIGHMPHFEARDTVSAIVDEMRT